ncbi:MAG: sugar phosphate isomerase/epimerase [Gemmataceae bacterium]|nr:sugar phosphate isomerase/epimerase [Gemmataceae bacterium]
MRYVYFTKTLQALDLPGVLSFLKEVGLDGADLAVRPGYPVHPDNALTELPKAAKAFQDEGLVLGLVTAPTNLTDPASRTARTLFEACGKAGVPALKLGYFTYQGNFEAALAEARRRLAAFAKLAAQTGVRACYHTHSGSYLGANGAALRLLLHDLDPHHVGAFVDTGHLAVGGGPMRLELDMVRPWFSLLAIKDMVWEKRKQGWQHHVVPVGEGIVRWNEVAQGLKECRFHGTVSLHGEYETKDLTERKRLAKHELMLLKSCLP